MSFFDDASLAFLPSGAAGKDGKAYSIKPTDGTGDFTFSRGSNLAATRVGADGLIEKGRENLILQSNQFDTTWIKISTNVTGGQSGYDGTNNAWLTESTVDSSAYLRQNNSQSGLNTFSIYAKAGTADFLCLYHTNGYAFFNVSTGEVGFVSGITASIVSVGSGWYRCSFSSNATFTQVRAYVCELNNSLNAIIGSNIYIQDAQLEIGLAATDVISTGATTGKAGLLEDEPRFDYSGGATCPSLLLEPSRTNLIRYSEYFAIYSNDNMTLEANSTNSPEGVQNAYSVVPTTTNLIHRLSVTASITSGVGATISFFAKANGYNHTFFRTNITGSYLNYFFDLVNETTSDADAKIEPYGNGWYRCLLTKTTATTSIGVGFGISEDGSNAIFSGDGTSGAYFYGAQIEEASYPTSYIPNHSGGSVTRGADSNVASGLSSVIGQTEGTIFIELDIENLAGLYRRIIGVSDGTIDNSIQLTLSQNGTLEAYISQGGTYSFTYYGPTLSTGVQKLAITYKTNEAKIYNNGTLLTTNTSVVVPACSNLYLGKIPTASVSGIIGNKIKQSLLFDTAISEADAITLTTL